MLKPQLLIDQMLSQSIQMHRLANFCRETRKCPPDAYSAPEGAVDCSPGCSVAKPRVNQQHSEPALEGRRNFGWIPRSSAVFRRPSGSFHAPEKPTSNIAQL